MFRKLRKSSHARAEFYKGQHRFEHWYLDNQVYFITARVRGRYLAFRSREARVVFWDRFEHYAQVHDYTPWVTSLIGNHYHTLGYLRYGAKLGPFMKCFHGSVAKLVNDILPERIVPFWTDGGHQSYFDGCIRDETQARRAYRYTLGQPQRHLLRNDTDDTFVRAPITLDAALRRATELKAFLYDVPYKRYQSRAN
jgi:hypothetical protein